MSTEKQINANRQNAQKSTGPKTDEGKAAVSKNAVKHGLFAAEAVIKGENPADYEAFLDKFLTDMKPVGAVETMLAERFVSLAWRLKRAERMQNQTIDRMIEREVTSPLARYARKLYYQAEGIPAGDERYSPEHLPLGRIAWKDFSNDKTLDRLQLYERRMENSMIRMLKEFKKQQLMRRIEQRDISEDKAIAETEALTEKKLNLKKQSQSDGSASGVPRAARMDLKKQSQFMPEMMGLNTFMSGDYGDMSMFEAGENKAKESQFDAPISPDGEPKSDCPPAEAAG